MNKNNIKYTQEQAVASWVKYLNTIRFENLMNSLNEQDVNLDKAITSLDNTLNEINKLIESDRGGEKGIHGFIAEISEVGIGNAKENIITPTDSLVLSEIFDGKGNATASGIIYGFVRIASRSKLKFSLNWSSFTTSIGLKINGENSGYSFYTFDPSKNVMAEERIPLLVSTTSYTNSEVGGSFSTTVTMKDESM